MTGVDELRDVKVVPAAPEVIRVSVLGGPTQLDVALPADLPVAAFLPELAKLIGSRDTRRDDDATDRDERRNFWVLSRIDGGADLVPDESLRDAGVNNGELLRISAQRALSPPTLYDDVVDAAARLNRAAYAPWNPAAAGVMALAGLGLCTALWVYFLVAEALVPHRGVVIGGAVLTTAAMVGGATLVHRVLGRADIAAAAGWPAIALSTALGWALAPRLGGFGLAVTCAVLLALTAAYYRLIRAGHSAYVAVAVVYTWGGLALVAGALGARVDVVAAVAATVAVLACLAVPPLTARLANLPTPAVEPAAAQRELALDNQLAPAPADTDSVAVMPSDDEVWARVRSAALTRAGLLTGLGAVVVVGAAALLHARLGVAALTFDLACAAVLALNSRRVRTVSERAALAVSATAVVLIACVQVQAGTTTLALTGLGVLVVVALLAASAGLAVAGHRVPAWGLTAMAYLEYVTVAALIPLGLWVLW